MEKTHHEGKSIMGESGFRTVMRGYDPSEVDQALAQLRQIAEQARAEAADRTVELTKLRNAVSHLEGELAAQTNRLSEVQVEAQNRAATPPTFAELGERIGSMLGLAEAEAKEMVDKAKAEAEKLTSETATAAENVRTSADKYAQEVQSKADADAARIVENAKRQSDEILDHADREATARREEAEAVYEHQRARAAAAAADFEKTLADRRDKAAADFGEQMAAHEASLARASERLASTEVEAERTRSDAETRAAQILKAAQDEASSLVDQAKLAAEKIRRESERELLAATSRRDAITAQLTNVRQMLATLGGGTIINPLADLDELDQPAAQQVAEEAVPSDGDQATDEDAEAPAETDDAAQAAEDDTDEGQPSTDEPAEQNA